MDLKDRMAELDARIAARKAAVDQRLGIAESEERTASKPLDPSTAGEESAAAGPGARGPLATQTIATLAMPVATAIGESVAADIRRSGPVPVVLKVLIVLLSIAFVLNLGWAIDRCLIHPPAPTLPEVIEALPNKIDSRIKEMPVLGSLVDGAANAAGLAADAVDEAVNAAGLVTADAVNGAVPGPDSPWWLFVPAAGEAVLALALYAILRSCRKKSAA
jgi:hypothetical protein